ncbi:MAG: alpha-glucosidase [Anaerolineales bacterium]
MTSQLPWWAKTTIYQIYPRSYQDSNGDGVGDLPGIISRLDYIRDLGFETIWLSPFFSSPQADWGYDVSDYFGVAPEYGTLADAEQLIDEIHKRGMRVLFDLVMNHTSIEHPWFQESRRGRDNPKRDWYIWRDGKGKRPPNNWKAIPGGPGWHYDEATGQYYFTSFLPFQPDLNFRNPEVKRAMIDVARFWLEVGVDGFRLDIFHSIYKDEAFRDNPFSFHYIPPMDMTAGFFQRWAYNLNQPEVFELAKELRAIGDRYTPERMLVGEVFGDDETLKRFLGEELDGLNLIFLWDLSQLKKGAAFFREVIRRYESRYPLPYTPVYVYGNHDKKRLRSMIGGDLRLAKLLSLLQFTVRGVPVVYYGEEIGMEEKLLPARTALDPLGQQYAWIPPFILPLLDFSVNRDGCRTPMQWDGGDYAGFSSGEAVPWLPVHENYPTVNVQTEMADDDSILHIYRKLLHIRKGSRALQEGTLELIEGVGAPDDLLAYQRESTGELVLIFINFGGKSVEFHNQTTCRKPLLAVGMDAPPDRERITLPPYSGLILHNG